MHDEATQTLNGSRTRQSFRLTQDVTVRLKEASPVTGGLIFDLSTGSASGNGGAGSAGGGDMRARQGGGKKRRGR
jgi:ribonuclease R